MSLQVINPFDQSVVSEIPLQTDDELGAKVEVARQAQERWRDVPLEERIQRVRSALQSFRQGAEQIARDVTLQMGKPIVEARREVETVFERAEHMISIAPECLAPETLPEKRGFRRRIEQVPVGVVLNLAAWNYPLIIPTNVVIPALLAGNCVILKHSARTPLCGVHFESAFAECGFPGLVASVVTTHEGTAQLIADSRIRHVSFTGSVRGGREIYREASRHLLDAGLELGGKDPAYIAEDADLEFACANVIDGACYNAGQSCCAVERVYVHRRHYDEFLERARGCLESYRLGDPLEEETTMGPLASAAALQTLEDHVTQALARGARLLLGGQRLPGSAGNFFEPTLLADVPNDTVAMQEESFGPIVPVLRVESDEEALRHMSDTRYGLTASVWTRDVDRAESLARRLDVGTVYQNRCDYLDPALPWTGVKESGMGSTLSRYGFFHLTRRKSIHFRVDSAV